MKNYSYFSIYKSTLLVLMLTFSATIFAQAPTATPENKSVFWSKVQFGGGVGLSIGSGYTDIILAPSAIYNLNNYVALGAGLQGSYVSAKNYFDSTMYGGSLISLFNPIEEIQLSIELEQIRVNNIYKSTGVDNLKDNFWSTGLFLGGGYRAGNATIGARYNVLFNKDKNVYSEAFMPFIRVYF